MAGALQFAEGIGTYRDLFPRQPRKTKTYGVLARMKAKGRACARAPGRQRAATE